MSMTQTGTTRQASAVCFSDINHPANAAGTVNVRTASVKPAIIPKGLGKSFKSLSKLSLNRAIPHPHQTFPP